MPKDKHDEDDEREEGVSDAWNQTVPPFTKEDNPHGLVAESSFTVRFPAYREAYLKLNWTVVKEALKSHGVLAELDLLEGSMKVVTSRQTWDPYIIIKARDFISLLARSMPIEKASKVLDDNSVCDIIKIDGLASNQERYVKRRQRIVGPDETTIKALELLTDCMIHVQGSTVSVVGTHRGVNQVRKVVVDTMKNVHPIFNIKAMMIKRELSKDEELQGENWNRFLPAYEAKRTSGRKKQKKFKKKEYTPFPPPQLERKVDLEMATGEYFMKAEEKQAKKLADRRSKSAKSQEEQEKKRSKAFVAPVEPTPSTSTSKSPSSSVKRKKEHKDDSAIDLEEFKKKIKKSQSKKRKVV